MCPIFPSQLPLPLVTLRLSTASLLDTVLVDNTNTNAKPLFSIETDNSQRRTTLYMYDHRQTQIAEVAAIQWPVLPYGATRTKQAPLVTILGQTESSAHFLKKSMLGGSRKFHVPGQQNPLKWKHVAEHYECTLCSHACTAHRAVATYEPAHTTSAARLAIYTNTVTNTLPVSEYKGVDMDMMVYLIVSIILLQTQHNANHHHIQTSPVSPRMASLSSHPSPISSVGNSHKIDLLAPDEAFVPSQQSTRGSPSSSSSCYSSLPASPISPITDLSPITNETFDNCPVSRSSSTRGVRRQSTRHTTTTTTSSSPRSGPTSITPYHLPPIEHHHHHQAPILRLQVPSPMASQAPSPRSNNALLLDTTLPSSSPTLYSSEQHYLQYSASPSTSIAVPPMPPTEEMPPAYSEIEWTVRVKQPRHVTLAY